MSAQQGEPMWFCYECSNEMKPLMTPDPQCPRCHSSFVEKIENPNDDPRNFQADGPGADVLNPLAFFSDILQSHAGPAREGRENNPSATSESPNRASRPHTTGMRLEFGGPNGRRTIILGGGNTLNQSESEEGRTPNLSDFLHANAEASGATAPREPQIRGPLMLQYLVNILGGMGGAEPHGIPSFSSTEGGPNQGRWGDYVFSQEALDHLMTQLMEGAASNRPVPATDEIMDNLPREVLEEGSALLEKDCAVCKEQFSATAEDPLEQVVITLPCKHPFHEGCILPWLKSSGTCPTCRHQLVPQPGSHNPGEAPQPAGNRPTSPNSERRSSSTPSSVETNATGYTSGSDRSDRDRRPSSGRRPSGDHAPFAFPTGGPRFIFETHTIGTPPIGGGIGGPGALFNILFGGGGMTRNPNNNNNNSNNGNGSQGQGGSQNQNRPRSGSSDNNSSGGHEHIPGN